MASTLLQTIANFETTISAKLTAAGTSLVLTTNLDKQGNAIPAGTYGFTLDEGKSNEEHIIGTLSGSTLTITVRNVSVQDGTTAGTGKEHRKNASIKITNHPLLVRMRRILDGTDSFNGASPVKYDAAPTFTPGSNQLVTVKYADDLVAGGVADATEASKGKLKLSVAAADVANPIAVGTNDPRIPTQGENDALVGTSGTPSTSNKFVTNDDTATTSAASKVPRANGSGKLDSSFYDTDALGTQQIVGAISNATAKLFYNIHLLFTLWTGATNGAANTDFENWYRSGSQIVISRLGITASFTSTADAYLLLYVFNTTGTPTMSWSDNNVLILDWFAKYRSGTGDALMGFFDGAADTVSSLGQDGAGFAFSNGSLYTLIKKAGTAYTSTAVSGVTVTNWNNYRIEVDLGADIARFYVNGVLKQTITGGTSFPTASNPVGVGFGRDTANPVQFDITAPYISIEMNP